MTEFPDIVLSAGKSKKRGSVSISGSTLADSKFTFNSKSKPIDITLNDIAFLLWMEVGRGMTEGGFVVKLGLKGNSFVKLSGFHQFAYNTLQSWLQQSGKELVIEKVSTRGANWGMLKVDNHRIHFVDKEELTIFDMPITALSQTVVQGKSEIAIEFPADDDPKSLSSQMETLCEIRVFVSNDEHERELAAAAAEKAEKAAAAAEEGEGAVKLEDGEEKEEEEEDLEEETAAQLLVKDIMSRTGMDDRAVQPIARFSLMFQSPRGKYSVDLYPTYLKLHSKTFQYKILYKFIQKMFLFSNPQQSQHYFVIGLNPPVRQGRTSYPYLLVQFDNSELMDESFNIDEKTCVETYKDIMQPQMKGQAHDVVTRVFKALTERKVLVPGAAFQSRGGGACIRCNLKANDGFLYVMEKSFFFVKKPLLHLRHSDIVSIDFRRVSHSAASGSKTFDMHVVTNEEKNNEYIFSSIQRDEYEPIFQFLKSKKLNISSDATSSGLTTGASGRVRAATNYDEEMDPHMNAINAERDGGDEDSDEDEDFEGGSSASSSESGSDVDEEASDSEVDAPVQKKRSKKRSADSDDDGDEEESSKKTKKRKRGAEKEDKKKRKPAAKSAYFHYLDEARPKYIAEHPELKGQMIQVTQALAAQWKALDAAGREKYNELAEASKAALRAERGDEEEESAPRKKRASKKHAGPKKPPAPQTLWAEQIGKPALKSSEPSLTGQEMKSKLAEQWKSMSEEEQQPWKEKILAAKKKYKIELEEWNKNHPAGEEDEEDAGKADEEGEEKKKSKKAKKSKKNKKEKKAKKDKKKHRKSRDEDASDASGDDADMEDAVKDEPMDD